MLCFRVGDRHLENILVTNDGRLLQIDFSYIISDDPKNLDVEIENNRRYVNNARRN